ncbi:SDR family NAD(P)-dependent oxidoreductase [Mesorhizobium sp. M0902]|uniref:SDR family NAD(P)-dependent oxidoreductase n=1 Tax=Mesorhizobium sp. M0902 TaxID=2957021 RepID=UPI003338B8A6
MKTTTRPVAIVTGSHGIDLGIATAFAKAGYNVAITGVASPDNGQDAVAKLESYGVAAAYLQSDVADVSRHEETVTGVLSRFGRVDCLVSNASMAVVPGDFLDLVPADFDKTIAMDLRGTVFFTLAVVKAMLVRSAADVPRSIINITSVSPEVSSPERADYCISKAELAAFYQGVAFHIMDTGVSVFEVRPGIERGEEAADLGKICTALASGDLGFATGTIIEADGGSSIPRL